MKAAEKKAEEECIAAEKKAEEERKAAEKKAEEERIAAEKKAEEERIAAEKKAEEERLAAEKKAEEERLLRIESYKTMTPEERAYSILFDLGALELTPDPDSTDYDSSKDGEYCDENVYVNFDKSRLD